MKTRTDLIAQLRTPVFAQEMLPLLFSEFRLLAAKIDLMAEALAVILDEQRPTP
jgi:hypothetical protein